MFEPNSATSRKFLEVVLPRLQTHGAARQAASVSAGSGAAPGKRAGEGRFEGRACGRLAPAYIWVCVACT
jgi:hypothetical protein